MKHEGSLLVLLVTHVGEPHRPLGRAKQRDGSALGARPLADDLSAYLQTPLLVDLAHLGVEHGIHRHVVADGQAHDGTVLQQLDALPKGLVGLPHWSWVHGGELVVRHHSAGRLPPQHAVAPGRTAHLLFWAIVVSLWLLARDILVGRAKAQAALVEAAERPTGRALLVELVELDELFEAVIPGVDELVAHPEHEIVIKDALHVLLQVAIQARRGAVHTAAFGLLFAISRAIDRCRHGTLEGQQVAKDPPRLRLVLLPGQPFFGQDGRRERVAQVARSQNHVAKDFLGGNVLEVAIALGDLEESVCCQEAT
eukprot:scaffold492_cov257-Pinguiococcus_pyrenoidosus.AAC.4